MKWVASFADRFSELIDGHTSQEMSDKLEISKTLISYYASGQRKPKTPALNHIAASFGVDPVWLLGGDVPKYKTQKSPGTVIDTEGLSDDRRWLFDYIMRLSDPEVQLLRRMFDSAQSRNG